MNQGKNKKQIDNKIHVSSIVILLVSIAIIIGGIFGALYFFNKDDGGPYGFGNIGNGFIGYFIIFLTVILLLIVIYCYSSSEIKKFEKETLQKSSKKH